MNKPLDSISGHLSFKSRKGKPNSIIPDGIITDLLNRARLYDNTLPHFIALEQETLNALIAKVMLSMFVQQIDFSKNL